jgi:hypothetical protein
VTKPAVPTLQRQGSRFYVHPARQTKAPSVTSIVGCLPKPALKWWAGKVVAQCAVDDISMILDLLLKGNEQAAVDHLKRAPGRSSGVAAQTGTDVHGLIEDLNKGKDIGRVHPLLEPYIDTYRQFLDDFKPEVLEAECTVWSDEHTYAGTLDAIYKIDNEVVLVDAKTGASGIWPDAALQAVAYARADFILDPDGTERPLPPIESAAALHIRPEGYELIPLRIDADVFEIYKSLLTVATWERELSKTVVGQPVDPNQ